MSNRKQLPAIFTLKAEEIGKLFAEGLEDGLKDGAKHSTPPQPMNYSKHPPPRSCYIRRALVGASPSAIFSSCTLGLRHRTKKCKGCTENVLERMLEGFEKGLRREMEEETT